MHRRSVRRLVPAGLIVRQPADNKTPDLLGDSCDLAGPVPVKPTKQERAAARAARYRARHGVAAMTVFLPVELLADFEVWFAARSKDVTTTKGEVIAKLIRQQLLRKR